VTRQPGIRPSEIGTPWSLTATGTTVGTPTYIAGFVGIAPGGPVDEPVPVTDWRAFARIYSDPSRPDDGPFIEGAYLAHAISGFFTNGGCRCWVVRIDGAAADLAERGLGALAAVDEVSMVAAPDLVGGTHMGHGQADEQQRAMIARCEAARDRMALLDPPPDLSPRALVRWRGEAGWQDSAFAALYYPWIEVMDPPTHRSLAVPPSGHVAGVWARSDRSRGVHEPPEGEVLLGANAPVHELSAKDRDELAQVQVNSVASVPNGLQVTGAQTLSSDPEWRYVNVRRLAIYIEESIVEGTQWAVHEPNDEPLWECLRRTASEFLALTWREGLLAGTAAEQAYFVKCDAETNPPDVIEAGQVVIEIGIAPVKPAEFVVFQVATPRHGASG
jgi:Bacteriophage tail sheath protein